MQMKWRVFCLGLLLTALARAAELSDVRDVVARWVETEKAVSAAESGWKVEEQSLRDLIRFAGRERDELEGRIEEFNRTATAADQERMRLEEEDEALVLKSEWIVEFLTRTEPRLRALDQRLPPPLRAILAPSFQKLPADSRTGQGVGERMQTVVVILNAIQKFDRGTPYLDTEVREDGKGGKAEVRTLYLGLGVGYYLRESDGDAGFLKPGPDEWTTVSRPELSDVIRKVMAVAEGESLEADFFPLPLEGVE